MCWRSMHPAIKKKEVGLYVWRKRCSYCSFQSFFQHTFIECQKKSRHGSNWKNTQRKKSLGNHYNRCCKGKRVENSRCNPWFISFPCTQHPINRPENSTTKSNRSKFSTSLQFSFYYAFQWLPLELTMKSKALTAV